MRLPAPGCDNGRRRFRKDSSAGDEIRSVGLGGDLGYGVLVDAVQAHQGVQDDEAMRDALHGLAEALAIVAVVEGQNRDIDDREVTPGQRSAPPIGKAQPFARPAESARRPRGKFFEAAA